MIKTANIHHPEYKESEALQQLLQAAARQIDDDNYLCETNEKDFEISQMTINVGGQSIAIIVGGPQYSALIGFVESIAAENGYVVDVNNSTVEE